MPGEGGEKTESASPKKRQDERKKGNIFMSKDITTVVSLMASFYICKAFIMNFFDQSEIYYATQMRRITNLDTFTTGDLMNLFVEFARVFVSTAIPAMLIMALISILATGMQTKFLFSQEMLKFKMSRLDPIKGIAKLFSLKGLVELAKSLIKVVVIIAILYNKVVDIIITLPQTMDMDIMQAAVYTGNLVMSILTTVGLAFIAIAGLDFIYQRWDYEKNIKMSKQEVKDEYKQMEGNPQIKGARRQKQREFAEQRMMSSVKEADVVVRNPTHYAVALRYNVDLDPAPIVLAKGVDFLAAKIVEEAEKHGVSMVENPPLARGLYAAADIEETIPAEFFQPVAELLAWIFTQKKDKNKSTIQAQKKT